MDRKKVPIYHLKEELGQLKLMLGKKEDKVLASKLCTTYSYNFVHNLDVACLVFERGISEADPQFKSYMYCYLYFRTIQTTLICTFSYWLYKVRSRQFPWGTPSAK